MQKELEIISKKLARTGVSIDTKKIKKHSHQGLMSTVYVTPSTQGELMVHLIKPAPEWVHQRIWEKILGIGNMLANYPNLPVSRVLLSGKIGATYFLVQERLPGKPAGRRAISKAKVVDTWATNSAHAIVPQIQKFLAKTHAIRCKGYGMPVLRNGKLEGKYKTWEDFFATETPRWLRNIKRADARTSNPGELTPSYKVAVSYTRDFLKKVPVVTPSLVHGDVINPSNLLVQNKKITGIIDWEWSLFADPAWEFCDIGWWPLINKKSLSPYLKEVKKHRKVDEDEFIERVHRYIPLWIMWGCNLHSNNPKGILYSVLRALLQQTFSS